MTTKRFSLAIFTATVALALTLAASPGLAAPPAGYIVQAADVAAARDAVEQAGGRINNELRIINAVSTTLSAEQAAALKSVPGISVFVDQPVKAMGGKDAYQIPLMGVDKLHAQGIDGSDVTVAVLDTGVWGDSLIVKDPANQGRLLAAWDAIANKSMKPLDTVGHGSHVTSIILGSNVSDSGKPQGVAPYAKLVSVRGLGVDGQGSYATVIGGLDWLLSNRSKYNIRVLNLSFGATAQSAYWNDPLNQAVMKLWQAGVVVVASAGNWGPNAQSITVPGNLPYVITVGAMTDNYTPENPADDRLASFSSTGPTYEGFVKPEIVAPGGHLIGMMDGKSMSIAREHPEFATSDKKQFVMSGTSQAAAAVSGVVALMLQAQPSLTPNQVKCKLMSSATAAVDSTNKLAYSVFQQGAGMVNALMAVYNPYTSCGNTGLNIAADIAGTQHYGGPGRQDKDGTFYLVDGNGNTIDQQGFLWKNSYLWNQGFLWKNGYFGSNGYLWNQGYLWSNGYFWKNGYMWNQSFVPAVSSFISVNHWVGQE